jgi:hypothetical protein
MWSPFIAEMTDLKDFGKKWHWVTAPREVSELIISVSLVQCRPSALQHISLQWNYVDLFSRKNPVKKNYTNKPMDRFVTYDFRLKRFCFGKYLKKCNIFPTWPCSRTIYTRNVEVKDEKAKHICRKYTFSCTLHHSTAVKGFSYRSPMMWTERYAKLQSLCGPWSCPMSIVPLAEISHDVHVTPT